MNKNIHDYSDIIDIPYKKSKNHLPMNRLNRSVQFAPFAALSGYSEAILEVERVVEKRRELSLEEKENLDLVLNYLKHNMNDLISVIYFIPDKKKIGGKYEVKNGKLKRINDVLQQLEFLDKTVIKIGDIYKIVCLEYENKF